MSGKRLKPEPRDGEAPLAKRDILVRQRALSGTAVPRKDGQRLDSDGKPPGDDSLGSLGSLDAVRNALAKMSAKKAKADPSLGIGSGIGSPDTLPDDPDRASTRQRALTLLARREHARIELERKLVAKGSPLDTVREVLDRLESQGLLSEERFAERYAASRKERGHGPIRILDELRERGIDEGLSEKAVNPKAEDWFDLAAKARRRRFGDERPDNYPEWARQARFLERRGFALDHIRAALGSSFDRA